MFVMNNSAKMDRSIAIIRRHIAYDAFLVEFFEAILFNLQIKENKLRFNNFAASMRELLRRFFADHAPSQEVLNCAWYKNITNEENLIARSERMKYYVQGGIADNCLPTKINDSITSAIKSMCDHIKTLNKYTHVEEKTFNLPVNKTDEYIIDVLSGVINTIECANGTKSIVENEINDSIFDEIQEQLFSNIPEEVDALSTHSSIEEISDLSFSISKIDSYKISICGTGFVSCDLVYGSYSENKRDGDIPYSQSFPLEFEAEFLVKKFKKLDGLTFQYIEVKTDSFYN